MVFWANIITLVKFSEHLKTGVVFGNTERSVSESFSGSDQRTELRSLREHADEYVQWFPAGVFSRMQGLVGQHQTGHKGYSCIRPNNLSHHALMCGRGLVLWSIYISKLKTHSHALRNTSHIFNTKWLHVDTFLLFVRFDLLCTCLFPKVCLT